MTDWPTLFFSAEVSYALGFTLIRSIWQILLVYLILRVAMKFISKNLANLRFWLSVSSLIFILLLTFSNFLELLNGAASASLRYSPAEQIPVAESLLAKISSIYVHPNLQYLASLWLMGVVFLALKLGLGFRGTNYLRKSSIPLTKNDPLYEMFCKLLHKLDLNQTIILKYSSKVDSPAVIGFLKPIILFPVGLVSQLSSKQIEMLLIHELAHIKRYDYLINIVVTSIQTLFYYHPAVWMIIKIIDEEREVCCDQLAINYTNAPSEYARALTLLNSFQLRPFASMNAIGNHYTLLNRVSRIFKYHNRRSKTMENLSAFGILILTLFLISFTSIDDQKKLHEIDLPNLENGFEYFVQDTIPKEPLTLDGQEIKSIQMNRKNGRIETLKINGEVVSPSDFEEYEEILASIEPPTPPLPPVAPAAPHPATAPNPPSPPNPENAPSPPTPPAPVADPAIPPAPALVAPPPAPPLPPKPPAPPAKSIKREI